MEVQFVGILTITRVQWKDWAPNGSHYTSLISHKKKKNNEENPPSNFVLPKNQRIPATTNIIPAVAPHRDPR
jgi:hypothetical protein